MLLLAFFLIPTVLAIESELTIDNYLLKIKDNILQSIKSTDESADTLNLSGLGIRGLDKNVFDDIAIKILKLEKNHLSELPEFVFANLTNLEILSLADNEIDVFKNAFVGLGNLKSLNISNNRLSNLGPGELFGLTKYCEILTQGNSIKILSSGVFENPFLREEMAHQAVEEKKEKENRKVKNHSEPSDKDLCFKVCIEEGIVTILDVLKPEENLPNDCMKFVVHRAWEHLVFSDLGISGFKKGWYRLKEIPITKLSFKSNKISQITKDFFNDLPEGLCTLDLEDNGIERMDKGIIENSYITKLLLNQNSISIIEDEAFEKLPNLRTLILDNNRLLDTKFVATLPEGLKILSLRKNLIKEITPNSFAKLEKLKDLNLLDNNITEVKNQAFKGLSSLENLKITNAGVKKIENGAFEGLKALEILSLNNNSLEFIESSWFQDTDSLIILGLARNKLTKIPKRSFPLSLRWLDLSYNDLEILEAESFVDTPSFSLDLSGNKIRTIEKGSLMVPNLLGLNLAKNSLGVIDGDWFEGLNNLTSLSLNENGIKRIEKGTARNLASLETLSLEDNPIKRLENGALFGLRKLKESAIIITGVPLEVIEGGLFDDV